MMLNFCELTKGRSIKYSCLFDIRVRLHNTIQPDMYMSSLSERYNIERKLR